MRNYYTWVGSACNKYYTYNIHKTPFIHHLSHTFSIIAYSMFTYLTLCFYDKYYFHFSHKYYI